MESEKCKHNVTGSYQGFSSRIGFFNSKWRRRESKKRLCLQLTEIQIIFFRYPSLDSVWIVSLIEFGVPISHDNIKPKIYGHRPSFESSFQDVAPPLITSWAQINNSDPDNLLTPGSQFNTLFPKSKVNPRSIT